MDEGIENPSEKDGYRKERQGFKVPWECRRNSATAREKTIPYG